MRMAGSSKIAPDGAMRIGDGQWPLIRHCEERSDEAIQPFLVNLDCFASLAMTTTKKAGIAPGLCCVLRLPQFEARFGGEAGHDLIRVS
jgi:hypothetical protein